jgi:hypothetical protein
MFGRSTVAVVAAAKQQKQNHRLRQAVRYVV